MQKSKKLTAVFALIMDLPMSIIVTLVALLVANNLNGPAFIMNCILAYIISFLINMLIPAPKWGFDFAVKHAEPGTFKFGFLLNLVVAFVFTVILDLALGAVGMLIIAHQPFSVYIIGSLVSFIPCYVTVFIIAMLWIGPSDKLSRKICNEPAPQQM